MNTTCPHCQRGILVDPAFAGQVVNCPFCRLAMKLPAQIATVPQQELLPPQQETIFPNLQQPPVFINLAQKPQPRLESTGWFARSFMTTLGVVAVLVGIPSLLCVLFCAGVMGAGTVAVQSNARENQLVEKQAKKLIWPTLKAAGVTEYSKDVTTRKEGSGVHIFGVVKQHGKPVRFSADFEVIEFGNKTEWHVGEISVNGKRVETLADK